MWLSCFCLEFSTTLPDGAACMHLMNGLMCTVQVNKLKAELEDAAARGAAAKLEAARALDGARSQAAAAQREAEVLRAGAGAATDQALAALKARTSYYLLTFACIDSLNQASQTSYLSCCDHAFHNIKAKREPEQGIGFPTPLSYLLELVSSTAVPATRITAEGHALS